MTDQRLDLEGPWNVDTEGNVADQIRDAIDSASGQDTVTWLWEDGKRIAAIVPVDVAMVGHRRYRSLAVPDHEKNDKE